MVQPDLSVHLGGKKHFHFSFFGLFFGKEIEKLQEFMGKKKLLIWLGGKEIEKFYIQHVESNDSNPLRQDIAYFLVRQRK